MPSRNNRYESAGTTRENDSERGMLFPELYEYSYSSNRQLSFFSVKHSHRDIMMIITPHFLRILVLAQHAAHRVLTTDLTFYVKGILIADINRDRLRSLHGEKKETGSYCFAQKLVG